MFSAKYVAMSPRYCSPSTGMSIPISSWKWIHSAVAFSSRARRPSSDSSPLEAFVRARRRSEEHTSELQSRPHLVCRLLLEKKKKYQLYYATHRIEAGGCMLCH